MAIVELCEFANEDKAQVALGNSHETHYTEQISL